MFEHLSTLDVTSSTTSWFSLPEIAPKAKLQLRPATQQNKQYFNAVLKALGRSTSRLDVRSLEGIDEDRRLDRDLYGKYVLAGWENIVDAQGAPVPFSRENAQEFCQKIPAWLFDKIRSHASSPERFAGELPDPETLAKNSEGGSAGV